MTSTPPNPSPNPSLPPPFWATRRALVLSLVAAVALTAGVTALLVNIFTRKSEQRNPYVRVVEVGENAPDSAKWGRNWPLQYDA